MIGDIVADEMTDEAASPSAEVQDAGYEVSPQQRRTWLLGQKRSSSALQAAVQIERELDAERVRSAVLGLVARHEILRTTFRSITGRAVPVQVIRDSLAPEWEYADISGSAPDAQAVELQSSLDRQFDRAFDFNAGPLFRVGLYRLATDCCVLSICLPAMCADASSLQILIEQTVAGSILPAAAETVAEPLQFADVADWQAELLESPTAGDAGHAYWREQELDELLPSMAFEQPAAPGAMHGDASITVQLDAALTARLEHSCAARKYAESALLGATWELLLTRLAGANVAVLHAASGRSDGDLKGAVGP